MADKVADKNTGKILNRVLNKVLNRILNVLIGILIGVLNALIEILNVLGVFFIIKIDGMLCNILDKIQLCFKYVYINGLGNIKMSYGSVMSRE